MSTKAAWCSAIWRAHPVQSSPRCTNMHAVFTCNQQTRRWPLRSQQAKNLSNVLPNEKPGGIYRSWHFLQRDHAETTCCAAILDDPTVDPHLQMSVLLHVCENSQVCPLDLLHMNNSCPREIKEKHILIQTFFPQKAPHRFIVWHSTFIRAVLLHFPLAVQCMSSTCALIYRQNCVCQNKSHEMSSTSELHSENEYYSHLMMAKINI